jgi:hypothetical protein
MRERLNNFQVFIMKSLLKRGASVTPVSIPNWQREFMPRLYRRGLVVIWYRHLHDVYPTPRGPFYTLTHAGVRLADALLHAAPRANSGAEKRQ